MILKNKFIFIISFIVFSCSNQTNNSFLMLENAFHEWYNKNHYSNINISSSSLYPYNVNLFNKTQLKEYYDDLSRFSLELSQIDYMKLSSKNKISFNYLSEIINDLSIIIDDVLLGDLFIYHSYYSLFNILEDNNILMYEKIDNLLNVFETILFNAEYLINTDEIFIEDKLS